MRSLPLLALLLPLAATAAALPSPPRAAAPAPAQEPELPLRFAGDGMSVELTAVDERTGEVSGTVQIDAGPRMPFTLSFELDARGEEVGVGRVQTPDGRRAIRSRDIDDETVQVTFRARRYTLNLLTGDDPVPAPAPVTSAGDAAAPATTAPAGAITLAQHTFSDPGMGGMKSHSVLVPRGWKAEGGAFWLPQQYFSVMPSQDIKVSSPDGLLVHVEPTMVAKYFVPPPDLGLPPAQVGAADGGYPVIPLPADLPGWKRWLRDEVIPFAAKGATRIEVANAVVIPELTWELARRYAPLKAMLEQNNGLGDGMYTRADCAVLGFESTFTLEGREYEELRVVALTFMVMEGQLIGRSTLWTIERAVTYRAPKGQLQAQMGVLKAVADSVQMTPEWFAMRADLQAKLQKIASDTARQNMEAARKRSEIIAQSGRDLSDIINSGYREREAIRDRTHEKVIHAIQGTEEYVTPGGGEAVHLPNNYSNVFTNGNGEYLLTNDALFEPNVDPATNARTWTRMGVRQ